MLIISFGCLVDNTFVLVTMSFGHHDEYYGTAKFEQKNRMTSNQPLFYEAGCNFYSCQIISEYHLLHCLCFTFCLQSGILHFCGFQVLEPQIFWSIEHTPPPIRTALLDAWRMRLKGIWEEKPLFYASCALFDLSFQGGFRLNSDAKEKLKVASHGITTGQHLDKPLPPNNQTKSQNDSAKTISDILAS